MTTAATVQPLDADDESTVHQWLDLMAAAAGDNPALPPPCPTDMVGSLRFPPPDTVLQEWVLRRDGRVAGALRLALPAGASTVRVDQLLVHPDLRRQGIGTALHGHALHQAAEHGRRGLTATLVEPLGSAAAEPGPVRFATAVGATRLAEGRGLHQVLDLADHDPLAAGLPAVPPGYELVYWGTITPDEYALAVSALELSLGGAAAGTVVDDQQAEVGASYARRFETMRVGRGRRAYHTGVVHQASGRLVGYTSISKTTGNPEYALQGMTVVHTAHRGHGLGLVVKLANLRHALDGEPALRVLETTNAADNAAMIAVNAAMGFRPVDRWVMWTSHC